MSYNTVFMIIKQCIDQMDYYALLAGGAPNDEFDLESKEISKRIRCDQSIQEIADVIADVFNASFDAHDDPGVFLPVAEQIRKELLSLLY